MALLQPIMIKLCMEKSTCWIFGLEDYISLVGAALVFPTDKYAFEKIVQSELISEICKCEINAFFQILLDQMTKNIVSYAMRTELLYKYFYDLTHNWKMQNTKSSLCERKAQDIDVNGVIDCCFRHAIHPEWNMQSDDSKNRLYNALKQMKEVYVAEDCVLIEHLMDVCRNPWTSDAVKDVLSGSKGAMTDTSNGTRFKD